MICKYSLEKTNALHMADLVWLCACVRAERASEVDAFNGAHRYRKRGLAMVPTKFGLSFTAKFMNQAGALVNIYNV